MLEVLKSIAVKISEAYDKLFKTWPRLIIFFLAWFVILRFLPENIGSIIGWALVIFIITGIIGRRWRVKK
ncbi:hypothetical protein FJZ53_01960 [Candidatus Woesearchaeota archaeon]|nr:hypothetical protein [Candidatus Woesearchaeota archaeon]